MPSTEYKTIPKRDFDKAFQKGNFFPCANFALKISRNGYDFNRIAFSVGKKYSRKATKRNKLKRLLRSSFFSIQKEKKLNQGFDLIVFLFKAPTTTSLDFKETKKQLDCLFNKNNQLYSK